MHHAHLLAELHGHCRVVAFRSIVPLSRFADARRESDSVQTNGLLKALGAFSRTGLPVCRDIVAMLNGHCGLAFEPTHVTAQPRCCGGDAHGTTRFWAAVPVERYVPPPILTTPRARRASSSSPSAVHSPADVVTVDAVPVALLTPRRAADSCPSATGGACSRSCVMQSGIQVPLCFCCPAATHDDHAAAALPISPGQAAQGIVAASPKSDKLARLITIRPSSEAAEISSSECGCVTWVQMMCGQLAA